MNAPAVIGHNNPPDPIDAALAPFGDFIAEAETWLDGAVVETEPQMKAVDALTKEIKAAKKAVEAAEESAAKPFYDQWKAEKARFKPTLDDLDRIVKGLVAAVDGFKRKLAQAKAEAERKAREEADRKAREAHEAAMRASDTDLEAKRAAAAAQAEAEEAQRRAAAASKDTVKGLRTVTRYEITDHKALLNWIAKNDRDAITEFIEEYARKEHKVIANADGIRVWMEKEAF